MLNFNTIALFLDNELNFSLVVIFFSIFLSLPFDKNFFVRLKKLLFFTAITFIVSISLKSLFAVSRPCAKLNLSFCQEGYSFPSSHSAVSFSLLFFSLFNKNFFLTLIFSLFISYSRIFLFAHTLIDVVGGFIIAFFVFYFLFFENLKEKILWKNEGNEMIRQSIHLLFGALSLFFLFVFGKDFSILGLSLLFFIALIFFYLKLSNFSIWFIEKFLFLAERKYSVPGFGVLTLLIGFLYSLTFFDFPQNFFLIYFLAIADVFSTLIGKKFGKTPFPLNNKKTIEGSVAFFLSFVPFLLFFPSLQIFLSLIFAVLAEGLTKNFDDNILIPIFASIPFLTFKFI
ncbi:MAG: phosphatase PAP2 family protein [Candidatus Anstonellaceae archaeon]